MEAAGSKLVIQRGKQDSDTEVEEVANETNDATNCSSNECRLLGFSSPTSGKKSLPVFRASKRKSITKNTETAASKIAVSFHDDEHSPAKCSKGASHKYVNVLTQNFFPSSDALNEVIDFTESSVYSIQLSSDVEASKPKMASKETINIWLCETEGSKVEEVENFDDEFNNREKLFCEINGCTSEDDENFDDIPCCENLQSSPFQKSMMYNTKYNYKRFISSKKLKRCRPHVSKSPSPLNMVQSKVSATIDSSISENQIEKVPERKSSSQENSPSLRLHYTDEDTVFPFHQLNPDVDKFPISNGIIKGNYDYRKNAEQASNTNGRFKTPSIPHKINDTVNPPLSNQINLLVNGKDEFYSYLRLQHITNQTLTVEHSTTRRSQRSREFQHISNGKNVSPIPNGYGLVKKKYLLLFFE